MNEVKKPKKTLLIFYCVVLALMLLVNMVVIPNILAHRVKEVDYGTFITMTKEGNVGLVQISESENLITFTDKDQKQIYKTGMVDDPDRTNRLYEAGAQFSGEIVEQPSVLSRLFFNWVLPIAIFFLIGQLISRLIMKKAGGQNSMMFNMGRSNAKIYVQSTNGIKFSDVAGEDEAKESLTEIVDYLHNPKKYEEIGAKMPKGLLLVGLSRNR